MDFLLPEGLPLWVRLIVLIIGIFIGICFLCMPFAVFGLKGRLNELSQQMEDVQAQLRILLKRTVDARERLDYKVQSVSTSREEVSQKPSDRKQPDEEQRKTSRPMAGNYVYPLLKDRKRSLEINSFEAVPAMKSGTVKNEYAPFSQEGNRAKPETVPEGSVVSEGFAVREGFLGNSDRLTRQGPQPSIAPTSTNQYPSGPIPKGQFSKPQTPYKEEQEGKLYDPPVFSELQGDERKNIARKRIEPILRWPPR